MKNRKLVLSTAISAVLLSGNAFAVINLDTGAGALTYASELNYTAASPLYDTTTATSDDLNGKLGFGVTSGQTRYIRLTYGNATYATGSAAATAANCVDGTDDCAIVQGGAATDSFVIYQFTALANRTANSTVTIAGPTTGLAVTSSASPVTVTFELYETATAAVARTSALYTSGARNNQVLASGLSYTSAAVNEVAAVADQYKKFVTGTNVTATRLAASLGTISYGTTAGVLDRDGSAIALGDMVTAATKITVAGQFGAAGSVYLSADTACTTATLAGVLNTGLTSADITVGTTAYATHQICYAVTGSTAIVAHTPTQTLDVTAATNANTADRAAASLGVISLDGSSTTVLNITNPTNADATFIRINNMGTTAARITGSFYNQDGTALGTAGTTVTASLAAKGTLVLTPSDLATIFGVTTWTGRAKLELFGEIATGKMRVQDLVRTNNVLTNVGGDTSTNNN